MDGAAVEVEPCSRTCARILERRGHLALLVSPGNPYFSVSRLTTLLSWAHREMNAVDVVVSDLDMTAATYLGQGPPAPGGTQEGAGGRATDGLTRPPRQ
ncbi:tRNA-dependent cyclodipeptide synthase [Streptomyces thinghirensis]|nr:tRNA-dependent cyclodipeptide synthase [Streptomyces thinghirensis]